MTIDLPYGENGKIRAEILSENLLGIIEPREMRALSNINKAVRGSLASPNGSSRLSKIIKHRYKVTIIVTDTTRTCLDRQLLPPILTELRNAGIPARAALDNSCVILLPVKGKSWRCWPYQMAYLLFPPLPS